MSTQLSKKASEWSNLAYLAPPAAALLAGAPPLHVSVFAVAWTWLAVGSWWGHRAETHRAWKADVTGMLAALSAVAAGAWAGPLWLWGAVPLVWAFYVAVPFDWYRAHRNYHVGAWAALGLGGLFFSVGGTALWPALLFLAAVCVRLRLADGEGRWHALWHLLTAAAGALAQAPLLT